MAAPRKPAVQVSKPRRPPATTPEARENQLIALSYDLAERQMMEGTASSQVITEFLRRGSSKERLEKEKLQSENELLKARVEALQAASQVESLYKEAIHAMRAYSGQEVREDEDY